MSEDVSQYNIQENQNGMNQELSDLFDEFVNQIVSDIDKTTEQIKGGDE